MRRNKIVNLDAGFLLFKANFVRKEISTRISCNHCYWHDNQYFFRYFLL